MHLVFHLFVVCPRRVHKVVFIVVLKSLHLFLLLVVVGQHLFVGLWVHSRLTHGGTTSLLLNLDDQFLFFILSKEIAELLAYSQLFVACP
jgi:hypothetical protein